MATIETRESAKKQEGKFSMRDEYENSIFTRRKPDMNEFKDTVYPHNEIANDVKELQRIQSGFTESINSKAARHLELIAGRNSDKTTDQWLGKNASVYETHDFDDVAHHIDMVVEFHDETYGLVRLGIDVTTAHEEGDAADRKRATIKKYAENNWLFPVKYFKGTDEKGNASLGKIEVPRAVVFIPTDFVEKYWNRLQALRDEISELNEKLDRLKSGEKIPFETESRVQNLLDTRMKQVKEYEGGGLAGLGFAKIIFEQIIKNLENLLLSAKKKDYREAIEKTLACVKKAYSEKKKDIEELENKINPPQIKKAPRSRKK